MINWKAKQDCWVEGHSAEIKLFINLSKDNKVNSLYIIRAANKQKFIPHDNHELELDCMKMRAEELLSLPNNKTVYF